MAAPYADREILDFGDRFDYIAARKDRTGTGRVGRRSGQFGVR
jgi:hypothetical protein